MAEILVLYVSLNCSVHNSKENQDRRENGGDSGHDADSRQRCSAGDDTSDGTHGEDHAARNDYDADDVEDGRSGCVCAVDPVRGIKDMKNVRQL